MAGRAYPDCLKGTERHEPRQRRHAIAEPEGHRRDDPGALCGHRLPVGRELDRDPGAARGGGAGNVGAVALPARGRAHVGLGACDRPPGALSARRSPALHGGGLLPVLVQLHLVLLRRIERAVRAALGGVLARLGVQPRARFPGLPPEGRAAGGARRGDRRCRNRVSVLAGDHRRGLQRGGAERAWGFA